MELIAEVKTISPFGWVSDYSWEYLFKTACQIGDMISIHTDPRWGGSLDILRKARDLTDKPILAKGIHATDAKVNKALAAGADWVLVVGRIPENLENCMIEPDSLEQLTQVPDGCRVVWNGRDLGNGGQKTETFEKAREAWNGWLCQASFIKTIDDVKPGPEAILVGSGLPEFAKSMTSRMINKINEISCPDF